MKMNIRKEKYYRLPLLMLVTLLAVFLYSCAADDDYIDLPENNAFMTIQPTINEVNKTRMTGANFDTNDGIGMYVVEYNNDNTLPGGIGNTNHTVNKEYIFNGNDWFLEDGTKIPWVDNSMKADIYAYYPYMPEMTTMSNSALLSYPLSVRADQSTKSAYEESDFLWAKSEPTFPTSKKIDLPFTHRLSKIRINLKSDNGFTKEELSNAIIQVYNIVQSGSINMSTGQVNARTGTGLAMTPFILETALSGYLVTLDLIVFPQTIAAGTDLISIRSYENSKPYMYTTQEALVLESSKECSFNINLSRSGITVSVGPIEDWTSVPGENGNITETAPKIVDLDKIDWDKSFVYKVMDNGVQIAEVNREYLYKTGTGAISRQAIIVYPMGSDGKADIQRGLVAQVMQSAINSVTQKYDVDATNIHGGYVDWNMSGNSISAYTAGTSASIRKVQISGTNVTAAKSTSVDFLDVEPDIITDTRGSMTDTYPMVKIGTQYWMQQNLRAEQYLDGSALTYYYYNDDRTTYRYTYGALYTWTTAVHPSGLAPDGWHIPTNDEFKSLQTYLGTEQGRKLKGYKLWSATTYSNNLTGFNAYPNGRRIPSGTYNEATYYTELWTSTQPSANNGARVYLDYGNASMWFTNLTVDYTQAVRCLRN